MKKDVSIVLIGIGGFGNQYVNALMDYDGDIGFKIEGVVDPVPKGCDNLNRIIDMQVPIYKTIEEFYQRHQADLAIISSPIQFHCEQTCFALEHGSNVLCEKPVSATIKETEKMVKARDKAGRFVAVGYQWSYSDGIQELKKDIMNGLFGNPIRMKTMVSWPRNQKYYDRTWAGKKHDRNGKLVLDSVANNAAAHFLHNMFYILGDKIDESDIPVKVTSELYRVNAIENFDTCFTRIKTDKGVELFFFATHATKIKDGPAFCYEFEKANIIYSEEEESIVALFFNGTRKEYENPFKDEMKKLKESIKAVKTGSSISCGIEAASSQLKSVHGMQRSMEDIGIFPDDIKKYNEKEDAYWVDGLYETIVECYKEWKLPFEMGVKWAKQGRDIELISYKDFE